MEEKGFANVIASNYNTLLSSAFRFLPFSFPPPPLFPPLSQPNLEARDCIQNLHISLASATDRCFQALNDAASQNPLLERLIYFSAHLRSFSQIRCRSSGSPNSLSVHNFAAILPGDSVAGLVVANGISSFLNIYNTLLVVRLVLTWFPNSPPAIVSPLSTLCDPYLNIFRGIIPPLGGLDLSPILAFLALNAFTSTAAALPAELSVSGASPNLSSSHPKLLNLTTTQKKWMRRVCRMGSKNSDDIK
ncbi:YGGT family protein [Tasmannia lanceolata]|uniref:YGGT family protein n=1 Tax=Tasmannia lanceolata TaxID=3420 RepID=UPI00406400F9